jgi:phospholipid/cholesterol/gamma-HCH transport system substrate-binding protein
MEQRFKFRYVNELTGLFVLGVLALVLAGVIFSEHSQQWFARKYSFGVLLPEEGALGLRRGDDVVILGVSVGLVDEIRVGDDGRMTAGVKIQRDFERFVRADSTASIKKVFGLAGDSFVEVTRGYGAALPLHKPLIACRVSEDSLGRMEKMLAGLHAELMPVVKKASNGLDEWTKLGHEWRRHGDQWHEFIAGLDTLATDVEEGQGTAGKLLTDTSLADEAQQLLTRANETMSDLQGVVTNLSVAVKNVQNGTARLPEITEAAANEAKDLPGLVQQTQTSMRELERLIEAMQRNWLVRKYVNKTNPPPARPRFKSAAPEQPPLDAPKSRKDRKQPYE